MGLLGANMAIRKLDLLRVNVFGNQVPEGCGEETDLEWRLLAAGVQPGALLGRAGTVHLYHPTRRVVPTPRSTGWRNSRRTSRGPVTGLPRYRSMNNHEKQATAVILPFFGERRHGDVCPEACVYTWARVPLTLICKAAIFFEARAGEEKDAAFDRWPIRFGGRTFSPATIFPVRHLLREKGIRNIFLGRPS